VEVYGLVRDFELLRVQMLARESMLVQVRIQLLSNLAVISLFLGGLGCVDSRNPYAPKSSRLPGTCRLPGALLLGVVTIPRAHGLPGEKIPGVI
jgi:hypothetical protein